MTEQPAILADFLRTELRGSQRRCNELLSTIEAVAANRTECREMTGNLYRLTITEKAARIDHLFDESLSLTLSRQGLADAIEAWRAQLSA